jgi:Zn finger protein HypA/HybF involved in hydrogenase expression
MPKKLTPSEYLRKAQDVHAHKYSYNLHTLSNSLSFAEIICPTHGLFTQILRNHLQGAGCPKCAGRGVDWVKRFVSVHGNLFDYSRVNYQGYKIPIEILCKEHGSFFQTPDNHYRGKQGCPKCKGTRIRASKQLKNIEFVKRAKDLFGDRFSYTEKQFLNMLTDKVKITCPEHGPFFQSPVNHLSKKIGCRKCANTKSTKEEELANYLSIFSPLIQRDRKLLYPKELDVYIPTKNIALEYCGMYWHSCKTPEENRKNKNNHYQKYVEALQKGVRVLTIFETEWEERNHQVKRLLRNLVGKSRGKVMARKCKITKVSHVEAFQFFEKYHIQGGAGSGEYYGLTWKDKLVACMRFTFGSNDRGAAAKSASWTLSRYATRIQVVGGASRLFSAFLKEHQPREVKSFSDNRYFDGDMYQKLGFTLEKELPPDYSIWSPKIGLKPKSQYQRRLIPTRLKDHGIEDNFNPETDPRTEMEMTFLMKCGRVYDCGKKRWVWHLDSSQNPV